MFFFSVSGEKKHNFFFEKKNIEISTKKFSPVRSAGDVLDDMLK